MLRLTALALMCADPAGAAGATASDEVVLMQRLIEVGKHSEQVAGASQPSASLEDTSLEGTRLMEAVARLAMNHSHASILLDDKKRRFYAALLARLTHLVEAPSLPEGWKQEALISCATGPGLGLTSFGLGLVGTIEWLRGCDSVACTTRATLSLVSSCLGTAAGLYNLEQDCGSPFLGELQDCKTNEGYFYKPEEKNTLTLQLRTLGWLTGAASGVWGSITTCKNRLGGAAGPINPWLLFSLSAASAGLTVNSKVLLDMFLTAESGGRRPDGLDPFDLCSAHEFVASAGLGLVSSLLGAIGNSAHDDTAPSQGWESLCGSSIAGAVSAIPTMVGHYCVYQGCVNKFQKAKWKKYMYGEEAPPLEDLENALNQPLLEPILEPFEELPQPLRR